MKENIFVTINHTDEYGGTVHHRVGDTLIMKKDYDNIYDDEAITVYNRHNCKCGYVANSVDTVARGTFSAGRIYDKIEETVSCEVRFILEGYIIVELL